MKNKATKLFLLGISSALTFAGVSLANGLSKHSLEVEAEEDPIYSYYASVTDSVLADKGKLFSTLQKIQWDAFKGNTKGYSALWGMYRYTDKRDDGHVRDYYSNVTNYTFTIDQDGQGKQSSQGQYENYVYNREHSIPKSWWGGSTDAGTPGTDIFIVIPTDAYVNSKRSNFPYGETDGTTFKSQNNFSKFGSSKVSGYSGNVFEPNDIYKGFLARTYFYAVATWNTGTYATNTNFRDAYGSSIFTSDYSAPNYGLSNYAKDLFYRWHSEHPVTDWEIARNEACYNIQGNRNPFIDHPEYLDIIWGNGSGAVAVPTTGVTLNKSSLTINKGVSETLLATVQPANATNKGVVWTSSDTSVATVSHGEVKGSKAGSATITATTSNGAKTATCAVTVSEDPVALQSISAQALTLKVGTANDLLVTVNPKNAYPAPKFTFKSSNESIATVSRKGEVVGKKTGSTKITVTATQGDIVKEASANITVQAQAESRLKSVYETAAALSTGQQTTQTYTYTGFVTGVLGPHFYVQDADYAMLVYNFVGHGVSLGQEVTVTTNLKNYRGTPESGDTLVSVEPTGNYAKIQPITCKTAAELKAVRVNSLVEIPSIKYNGRDTGSERNGDILAKLVLGGVTFTTKIAGQNSDEAYYKYGKSQVLSWDKGAQVNVINAHRTIFDNKEQLELSDNTQISHTAAGYIEAFNEEVTTNVSNEIWAKYKALYENLNEEQRLLINDLFNGTSEPADEEAKNFVEKYNAIVSSGKQQSYLIDDEGEPLGPKASGMPTWLLITIIASGVVVLAAAGVLTFIIIKKKRQH